ncbi:DUF6779 domain-containing protein [Gordonia sp. NPDC003424]
MTTPNGRSAETRRSGRSVGQWLLGLLIVLALVASILMVFTDQLSVSGSLAVIAALWAAVIGAILVTKFRRQAESAEAKSRDLRLVYELQLEREIAARRQYELDVETTIRKEVSAETGEEMAELKAQVLALRASLEMLLGESLPDPRVALPSEKLRELASGIGGEDYRRYGGTDDSVLAARDFAATAPAADLGRHVPIDVDPNELTEVIPVITDEVPVSGRIATESPAEPEPVEDAEFVDAAEPSVTEPAAEAVIEEVDEVSVVDVDAEESDLEELDLEESDLEESGTVDSEVEAPYGEPAFGGIGRHETAGAAAPVIPGRRRRRTSDDGENAHTAGLPVSELLSQLREAGAAGGRRRRED